MVYSKFNFSEHVQKNFETFGGIKDTILHNKQKKFHDQLNIGQKNMLEQQSILLF